MKDNKLLCFVNNRGSFKVHLSFMWCMHTLKFTKNCATELIIVSAVAYQESF